MKPKHIKITKANKTSILEETYAREKMGMIISGSILRSCDQVLGFDGSLV